MNKSTLKPCPFCGHEAYIQPSTMQGEYGRVICSGCHASTLRHPTLEQLVAAWNMRFVPECTINDYDSEGDSVPESLYGDGFCSECDTMLEYGDGFCKHCGFKVM